MSASSIFSQAKPNNPGCGQNSLFQRIGSDIYSRGYSICPAAMPADITQQLLNLNSITHPEEFSSAGVGRGEQYLHNEFVRTDEIAWITGETAPGQAWLDWAAQLQTYLSRRLFLGLFSFESHLAHYAPGDYYRRHLDAFKGEANRVLSVVVYLNSGWRPEDGGELVLYRDAADRVGVRLLPLLGTIAVFLSEDFPHEVLPARRDRYSIAGWFRVNTTRADRVDPPR